MFKPPGVKRIALLIFPFALFAGAATWFIGDQWLTRNDHSGSAAADVP